MGMNVSILLGFATDLRRKALSLKKPISVILVLRPLVQAVSAGTIAVLTKCYSEVHTFTIKELIGQGWHLILKEGTHEFTLTAPSQPGKYRVECMAYCGEIHQDMSMIMIVVP